VSDWHWEHDPDNLLDGLPEEARHAVDALATEIAVRESMIFLDGAAFSGTMPGVRTEQRGDLMLTYLTDVRGERVVIIQVTWMG
jgi:hypothetical protein